MTQFRVKSVLQLSNFEYWYSVGMQHHISTGSLRVSVATVVCPSNQSVACSPRGLSFAQMFGLSLPEVRQRVASSF
eukprot:1693057-Amphidinium_carterae.1